MASLLLPALVALASTVHGEAPFSCPKVAPAGVEPTEEKFISRPWVDGAVTFVGGKTGPWAGASKNVTSPIVDTTTGQRIVVGQMAQMKAGDALQVPSFPPDTSATHPFSLTPLCSQAAEAAKAAWRAGQGLWPQMSPQQRIDAIERFVDGMLTRRAGIVNALMWEICKNTADAGATPAPARLTSLSCGALLSLASLRTRPLPEAEFDRTIAFIRATVAAYRAEVAAAARWETVSGVRVTVRRLAVGIMLCLSPFNYPLNEVPYLATTLVSRKHIQPTRLTSFSLGWCQAYAALIPALLTGNVAIMKVRPPFHNSIALPFNRPVFIHLQVPATGGLAHYLTADAFAQALPPGVINFVSGSGRDTMPPLMRTGDIDILAFIGG
jgi:glyceraldehyde-3-phosphate dehydrogenase (NADP+)